VEAGSEVGERAGRPEGQGGEREEGCAAHSQRGRVCWVSWRHGFCIPCRCHRGSHGRGRHRAWGRGNPASHAPLRLVALPGHRAAWRAPCGNCSASNRAHGSRNGGCGPWGRGCLPRRCVRPLSSCGPLLLGLAGQPRRWRGRCLRRGRMRRLGPTPRPTIGPSACVHFGSRSSRLVVAGLGATWTRDPSVWPRSSCRWWRTIGRSLAMRRANTPSFAPWLV
jgi:hypothetical protein